MTPIPVPKSGLKSKSKTVVSVPNPSNPRAVSEDEVDCHLLLLPIELREKIYSFLTSKDFTAVRLVCDQLRYEAEVFGSFSVNLRQSIFHLEAPIPFAKIDTLTIDNDSMDLPWGDVETDIVKTISLANVTFKTFQDLGALHSPKYVTLKSNIFYRPIPTLAWSNLLSLRIKFYVPPERAEEFMLDNLDTLFEQKFELMKDLSLSLVNAVIPNLQSQYAIRVARFVAKHWASLKYLHVTMEARRCVRRNYVLSNGGLKSGLREEEAKNFGKVQLKSLELNISELSCPRCAIWRTFIQQQNNLESLSINVSGAEKLPSDFFCNTKKLDQFTALNVLSVRLWGLAGFYPFDFRYLKSAKHLSYIEIGRYPEARSQLTRPELLNVDCIPEDITSIHMSGFLIASADVEAMLTRLTSVTSLTLLDCGSGLDIGITVEHVTSIANISSLSSGVFDFNTADPNSEKSRRILKSRMGPLRPVGLEWRYLYDIGFHQCHRFEIARQYREFKFTPPPIGEPAVEYDCVYQPQST